MAETDHKMKKRIAAAIREKAEATARSFSHTDRPGNHANETYELTKVEIMSESTAVGLYRKSPTGQWALAFFCWINAGAQDDEGIGAKGYVVGFFVSYAHALGMERVKDYLMKVESANSAHKGLGPCAAS